MLQYSRVCLDTFGYQLPPRILASAEIENRLAPLYERLRLTPGRLELMTGIQERRLWPRGTKPSEAAIMAGRNALDKGGWDPARIDCLIFTSVSRDMMEPATASFVHLGLGLPPTCLIFDISNACLGFLDGMVMLANMIELGQVENGLVVSGETAEELLESTLETLVRDTSLSRKAIKPAFASLTIGSGAIALVMERAGANERRCRLVHGSWRASTVHSDLCHGNQHGARTTLMETNSEELMHRGVEAARQTWQLFSSVPGWGGRISIGFSVIRSERPMRGCCSNASGSIAAKILKPWKGWATSVRSPPRSRWPWRWSRRCSNRGRKRPCWGSGAASTA